jgi:predicted small lipoprotein YifL
MTIDNFKILLILAPLAALAACGSHGSLTAPSSATSATTTPAPTPAGAGATIVGTISGASGPARTGSHGFSTSGVTVTVAGTSVSCAVDQGGNFLLTNVPPIQVVLDFSGPGIDASLPLGAVADNDRVQIGVTLNGTTATLDTQQRTGSNKTAEAEGRIDSIDAKSRQLVINGGLIQVATDAVIRRGDTLIAFADLKAGDRVHVRGVMDGTTIRASEVMAQSVTPPTPAPATPVTLSGTVIGVGGTCPTLSLKVGETYVTTNAATTFSGKSCGDIRTGDSVQIVGTKPADNGIVTATKIAVTVSAPAPPAQVTLSGTVIGVGGTCPMLSLKVGETYVTTNAATTFSGKSCGEVKAGDSVQIVGTKPADSGMVTASKVTVTSK